MARTGIFTQFVDHGPVLGMTEGLTPGTQYSWTVQAINAYGIAAMSAPSVAGLPGPVTPPAVLSRSELLTDLGQDPRSRALMTVLFIEQDPSGGYGDLGCHPDVEAALAPISQAMDDDVQAFWVSRAIADWLQYTPELPSVQVAETAGAVVDIVLPYLVERVTDHVQNSLELPNASVDLSDTESLAHSVIAQGLLEQNRTYCVR